MANHYKQLLIELGFYPFNPTLLGKFLNETDLKKIEEKLGSSLPQDYRQFLGEYSSISASKDVYFPFSTEEGNTKGLIIMFLGAMQGKDLADHYYDIITDLQDDENCTLETYPGVRLLRDIDTSSQDVGWPEELLPIGSNPGGNSICIAFKGSRSGSIFYWRANPWEGKQNLYLIANSFDDFIHMLKAEES